MENKNLFSWNCISFELSIELSEKSRSSFWSQDNELNDFIFILETVEKEENQAVIVTRNDCKLQFRKELPNYYYQLPPLDLQIYLRLPSILR